MKVIGADPAARWKRWARAALAFDAAFFAFLAGGLVAVDHQPSLNKELGRIRAELTELEGP